MKTFLLLSMLTFIDGELSHREEAFVYELNDDATLEYCEKHIAPYFVKKIKVQDGVEIKIESECYEGETREK